MSDILWLLKFRKMKLKLQMERNLLSHERKITAQNSELKYVRIQQFLKVNETHRVFSKTI